MDYFTEKAKRRSRLNLRAKYKNMRRNGISRKGDPISNRCNDYKCIEFRKLKEVE